MSSDKIVKIISGEIDSRLPDIGDLVEETISFHFDVLDGNRPGNKMDSGGVYCIEHYLSAKDNHDFHLRNVKSIVMGYLEEQMERYPTALQANLKPFLGFGVASVTLMMGMGYLGPYPMMAGIVGTTLGTMWFVPKRIKDWRLGYVTLYETRKMFYNDELNDSLETALESHRDSIMKKFGERNG